MEDDNTANRNLEDKVIYMEKNLKELHPERFKELSGKLENMNNTLKTKDNIID